MPHGPSSVGKKLRERKLTPRFPKNGKNGKKDLDDIASIVIKSDILKPPEIREPQDGTSLHPDEPVTIVFDTKYGESHFILNDVCGR
ncbi:hypothetical protein ACF0H5_017816 [Mactra antiquata]